MQLASSVKKVPCFRISLIVKTLFIPIPCFHSTIHKKSMNKKLFYSRFISARIWHCSVPRKIQIKSQACLELWLSRAFQTWTNVPLSSATDSATASSGGGSIALFRNSPISPSFNNLIVRASSWSGVRRISGVACSASLKRFHQRALRADKRICWTRWKRARNARW